MKQIKLYPLKNPVTKTIEIPGSKSYTNRALLMAALTKNSVTIKNPLFSNDTIAMIDCLKKLGIKVKTQKNTLIVDGSIDDVEDKTYELNAQLAATVIRFLLPLLCVVPGKRFPFPGRSRSGNRRGEAEGVPDKFASLWNQPLPWCPPAAPPQHRSRTSRCF